MTTLKQLAELARTLNDERGLNRRIFDMIGRGQITLAVFLEYQELTQTDVLEALKNAVNATP